MKIDLVPVDGLIAPEGMPDEFTVTIDGVTLTGFKAIRTPTFTWEILYQSFDRNGNGAPILHAFAYSIDEVYQEIKWYREFVTDIRERDHATAIILDTVNGDAEKIAKMAKDSMLAFMHAAGMLMNEFGENDPRFDALKYVRDISDDASMQLRDLWRGIRAGHI